jgi:hypothetical protein
MAANGRHQADITDVALNVAIAGKADKLRKAANDRF